MSYNDLAVALGGQYGQKLLPSWKPPDAQLIQSVYQSSQTDASQSKQNGGQPIRFIDVPLVYANENTLDGFGELFDTPYERTPVRIKQWPSKGNTPVMGGTGGGVTEGMFTSEWNAENRCIVRTESVGHTYNIGWKHAGHIFLQDANYHPDGTQIFESLEKKPYILVLSKHLSDVNLTPHHFFAFYCSGLKTISLHPNVWHQAVFPLDSSAKLYTKQGKIHGVVNADFKFEYGVYLRIPNALNKLNPDKLPKTLMRTTQRGPPEPSSALTTAYRKGKCPKIDQSQVPPTLSILNPNTCPQFQRYAKLTPTTTTKQVPHSMDTTNSAGGGHLSASQSFNIAQTNNHSSMIKILPWPQKERPMLFGDEAGLSTPQRFSMEWDENNGSEELLVIREGRWRNGGGVIWHNPQNPNLITYQIDSLTSRLDGGHLIQPREPQSFIILVAEANEGHGGPELDTLRCYEIDGGQGLVLEPLVWHSHPLPNTTRQLPCVQQYNKVNAHSLFSFTQQNLLPPKIPGPRIVDQDDEDEEEEKREDEEEEGKESEQKDVSMTNDKMDGLNKRSDHQMDMLDMIEEDTITTDL